MARGARLFRRQGGSASYVLKRLITVPVMVLVMTTLGFALVNLIQTDPARQIAGQAATPANLKLIRERLGVDQPLLQRYFLFLDHAIHGNFGNSYYTTRPVLTEFETRVTSSLELVIPTVFLAWGLGVVLGVTAAYWELRWPDRAVRSLVSLFQSVPDFLVGIILIYVLFYVLRWAAAPSGQLDFSFIPPPQRTGSALVDSILAHEWAAAGNALYHMVLPVLTLTFVIAAYVGKNCRALMIESLRGPSAEFARACGLSEWTVVRYAFRESRTPLLTIGGVTFAALLGGEAIVEYLFAWNGLGQWALTSITQLDLPVILAYIVLIGLASLLVYVLVEVAVVALDPRLSLAGSRR